MHNYIEISYICAFQVLLVRQILRLRELLVFAHRFHSASFK